MKWSWKLGEVSGIVIKVHVTMLLLLVFLAFSRIAGGAGPLGAMVTILGVLAIFACVLLHELGHALTAQRFGIKTRDITLLPIGGVAQLERMPRDPRQELLIAIAGPTVNVFIVLVLALIKIARGEAVNWNPWAMMDSGFIDTLLAVNMMLVLFNLLPAFPMDGGRVLRALLAQRMPYTRATSIAASVGQGMAFLFGFWGLMAGNFLLLFIALFVYVGAGEEAAAVQMTEMFRGVPVRQAMVTRFRTLSPHDTLAQAVEHLLRDTQQDFPVVETSPVGDPSATRLVGMLPRSELMRALAQVGPTAPVAEVMRTDIGVARPLESLEKTFTRMQSNQWSSLPVMDGGRLVGLVTLENIGEYLMVRAALEGLTTDDDHREAVRQMAERYPTRRPAHRRRGDVR